MDGEQAQRYPLLILYLLIVKLVYRKLAALPSMMYYMQRCYCYIYHTYNSVHCQYENLMSYAL
jgi:hypothetical protein